MSDKIFILPASLEGGIRLIELSVTVAFFENKTIISTSLIGFKLR